MRAKNITDQTRRDLPLNWTPWQMVSAGGAWAVSGLAVGLIGGTDGNKIRIEVDQHPAGGTLVYSTNSQHVVI